MIAKNKFTIHARESKRRFSGRKQWKFQIIAANGEPIDPRDTYANIGDIRDILTELTSGDTAIDLIVHYEGKTVTEALR